jgi:sugar lactone lactonase YvrE
MQQSNRAALSILCFTLVFVLAFVLALGSARASSGTPTATISGTVLEFGTPAPAGIRIDLWHYPSLAAARAASRQLLGPPSAGNAILEATTYTTSSGTYSFAGVPIGGVYFVEYYNGWDHVFDENTVGYWATPATQITGNYQAPTFDIGYNEQNNLAPIGQTLPMPTRVFPTQFSWASYPGATLYAFQIIQEPLNWQPGQSFKPYYAVTDRQAPGQFQEPCSSNAQDICFTYEGGQTYNGGGLLPIGTYLWGPIFANASGQGGALDQYDSFAPRILDLNPSFDAAGQPVTLDGIGFDGSNLANDAATFGTAPATIRGATSNTLAVTVPTSLSPGPQMVMATVTTTNDPNNGDQPEPLASNGETFTVTTGTVTLLGDSRLRVPDGLALDTQDNLYVANFTAGIVAKITQANQISEYAHVPSSGQTGPAGLTFDQAGNLYIADYAPAPNGAIYKVPPGGGTPTVFASDLYNPSLMATDSAGNIWVAEYGPTDGSQSRVLKYSPGGQLLLSLAIKGADSIAFDGQGNVYIAAYQEGIIWTFPNVPNPQPTIYVQSSSLVTCDALAFDPSGNLWVTTYGTINQANGNLYEITPQKQISLFAQGLVNPAAIAFDASGALYLVMTGAENVWKYVQ